MTGCGLSLTKKKMLSPPCSVVLLVLVSLSISCALGKVRGCSIDSDASVEICVGGEYNRSDWFTSVVMISLDVGTEFQLDLIGSKGRLSIPYFNIN